MTNPKKNPYPNDNFAIVTDYLEELVKVASREKGLIALTDEEKGYEDIFIEGDAPFSLNYPPLAISAIIMVESSSATQGNIAVRFKENGGKPTKDSGFGIAHNDVYEIVGRCNLQNFKVVGSNSATEMVLRVQYYTTGQDIESEDFVRQLKTIDKACEERQGDNGDSEPPRDTPDSNDNSNENENGLSDANDNVDEG